MEEVGRRGVVGHDHVVFGAELQESLQAGARVLRTLSVIAVRQQQRDVRTLSPLGLCTGNELIDHDLSTVCEVAKLCFPDRKTILGHRGIAVFKAHDGVFGQGAVVDAQACRRLRKRVQRDATVLVDDVALDGLTMVEGASTGVLSRDADAMTLHHE